MIDPLTTKCPKCGHTNRASAMNCEACHINLRWALANSALFKTAEGHKQEMAHLPVFGGILSHLQKKLGLIIIILLFVLIVVFLAKPSWGFGLLMLLVFGAWLWFTSKHEASLEAELENIWSELARETGLTYIPGKHSFLGGSPPIVRGEYRGVPLSIEYVIEGGGGEYDVPTGFTKIMLLVRNPAGFSLEISDRWPLLWRRGKRAVLSGNQEFDWHFQVKGAPQEFLHQAIGLADLKNILLMDKTQSKVMKNPYLLSWSGYGRPSITLKRSELICWIHGAYKRVDAQIPVLNLLCDLAQLAERMRSEITELDERV